LAQNGEFIYKSLLNPEDGQRLADDILKLDPRPDGIFSANDLAAIAAMKVFQENGINIPSDIKIVGFSNEPLDAYANPPLSSVDQNPTEIGKTAAEILIGQIESKILTQEVRTIDSSLVIRDSSMK